MARDKKEISIIELNLIRKEASKLINAKAGSALIENFEEVFLKIFNKNDAVKLLVEPETGQIVDANKTACEFYNYAYEVLISKKITEINKLTEREVIEEYKKQKNERRDFFINKQEIASGEVRKVEVRSASIIKDKKKFFYFLIHDAEKKHKKNMHIELYEDTMRESSADSADNNKLMISEGLEMIEKNARDLIMLTTKLADSERKLKELNASKDRFFSIISHDIKNSFSAILGLSRLLDTPEHNADPYKRRITLKKLQDSSKKLYALLENLLEWAKVQRNEIQLRPTNLKVKNICDEVVELLSLLASEKEIMIKTKINPSLNIFADHNMARTVIRNLVNNAINFSHKKGIVSITADENDSFVSINVKDDGVGINEDNLRRLFRIDEKFIGTNTQGEKGTGLGLILVREFVEKNRGKIKVESEINKGSTFTVAFPKNSSSDFLVDSNGRIVK